MEILTIVNEFFNKNNVDGVIVPLNLQIVHNFQEFTITELYKYEDESYSFYWETKTNSGSWYLETIDSNLLNNILNKLTTTCDKK
jgi:hypothetical protein